MASVAHQSRERDDVSVDKSNVQMHTAAVDRLTNPHNVLPQVLGNQTLQVPRILMPSEEKESDGGIIRTFEAMTDEDEQELLIAAAIASMADTNPKPRGSKNPVVAVALSEPIAVAHSQESPTTLVIPDATVTSSKLKAEVHTQPEPSNSDVTIPEAETVINTKPVQSTSDVAVPEQIAVTNTLPEPSDLAIVVPEPDAVTNTQPNPSTTDVALPEPTNDAASSSSASVPSAPKTGASTTSVAVSKGTPKSEKRTLRGKIVEYASERICDNCKEDDTPHWYRFEVVKWHCNACSLHWKRKGVHRPVEKDKDEDSNGEDDQNDGAQPPFKKQKI